MLKSEKENKCNFHSYSADNVRQSHIEALKPHLQDSYR